MEAKACHHQNIRHLRSRWKSRWTPSAYVTGVRHSAFSISNPSIDADVVSSRFLFHFFTRLDRPLSNSHKANPPTNQHKQPDVSLAPRMPYDDAPRVPAANRR